MKNSNGLFGVILYAAVMLGLAGYMLIDHFYLRHIPTFQVGECAAYITEGNEFEKPRVLEVIQIRQIGKRNYQYLSTLSYKDNDLKSDEIWWVNKRYVKVDCNTGK